MSAASPDRATGPSIRARLHAAAGRLAREHASTPRLAAGVACGVFVGSSPFYGLHALIGLVLSRLLRLNSLAVLLGTQVSLPFLAPFLVVASVEIGHRLLAGEWLAAPRDEITLAFARSAFVEWLLGSAALGAVLAAAAALATVAALAIVRRDRAAPADRWSGRSRGNELGYTIFFYTLRALGRRGGYALLVVVTLYYFLFARTSRRHSREYLRRVLGERTFLERQVDAWRHFQSFGRSIVDRVLLMAGGKDEFTYEHENVERIIEAHRAGQGVVLLSAHVGSWAIAGDVLGDVKPTLVVFDNEAEGIRRFFARHRSEAPKLIVVNDGPTSAVAILQALRAGEMVAMLSDRVRGASPSIRVPFLGEEAEFPVGPFLVALLSGAPMIMTFSMKEGPRHHHFFALPAERFGEVPRAERDRAIREKVEWFARELEAVVRRYPYQWYNLYDFWPQPLIVRNDRMTE